VNWVLSDEYHDVPGGHVPHLPALDAAHPPRLDGGSAPSTITTPTACTRPAVLRACRAGPTTPIRGRHVPQALVWDIVKGPKATRMADKALSPLIGKSLVVY